MPEQPHLNASQFIQSIHYPAPRRPVDRPVPRERDRDGHGRRLLTELRAVRAEDAESPLVTIELRCNKDIQDSLKSLDDARGRFELLNALQVGADEYRVTVRLYTGGLAQLERKIIQYLREETSGGIPKNTPLIHAIEAIRRATLASLWTEPEAPMPTGTESVWWEGWLVTGGQVENRRAPLERFHAACEIAGVTLARRPIAMPERTLVYFLASPDTLAHSAGLLHELAELRKPMELSSFFDDLPPAGQREWIDTLTPRILPISPTLRDVALLDSGVAMHHPLLSSYLAETDCLAVEGADPTDRRSHGTAMASLVMFGDLNEPLGGTGEVEVSARVRSVNLLTETPNHAIKIATERTCEGVGLAEAGECAPVAYCFAQTMDEGVTDGTPDAWSSVLDLLAYGCDDDEVQVRGESRLFLVSAGNVDDPRELAGENASRVSRLETPAHAWNAVTVGGCTFLASHSAHLPAAVPYSPHGGHSPYARHTAHWERRRPIKPEVVFEAGNAARTGFPFESPDWQVLVANAPTRAGGSLLATMSGTSPATAFATRFIARLAEAYPDYSSLLLRALLIHSAEWTPAMIRSVGGTPDSPLTRAQAMQLARRVGYGFPRWEKAVRCANNRVAMVMEHEFTPFQFNNNSVQYARMAVFDFREWPVARLLEEHHTERLRMKVTLAYFIEPNPGNRAYVRSYSYASYGLRFFVSHTNEERGVFIDRLTASMRSENSDESDELVVEDNAEWQFGVTSPARTMGSVHSDTRHGSAAEMIRARYIAIIPSAGWWKSRRRLERYSRSVKFSLVVSFETEANVDLYTPLAAHVVVPTPVPVEIPVH